MASSTAEVPSNGRQDVAGANLVAASLLVFFVIVSVIGIRLDSPTIDEPAHLLRGLSYWWTGDTRLCYAHPPLADALMALPVALSSKPIDIAALQGWDEARIITITRAFMDTDYGRVREQILIARHVTVFFSVVLGLYLFRFMRWRWGDRSAILALGLYCLHPTLMAHGRLVTTDMPLALASTIAVGEAARYFERPKWGTLLGMALAVGAALAIKFSAIYLVPLLLGLGLIFARRGGAEGDPAAAGARYRRFAGHAALVMLVSLLVVNGAYRFQKTGWTVEQVLAEPEPRLWKSANGRPNEFLETYTLLGHLPSRIRFPLPYTYIFGLYTVGAQSVLGHSAYLLGVKYSGGWAIYFPVMLLVKNPLAVLLAMGMGAVRLLRTRIVPSRAMLTIGAAAGLFFGFSLASNLNIGVRHVLPMMPLFVMIAGRSGALLWEEAERRRRILLGLLAAGTFVSAVAWTRHPIGYFNALCLGPIGGPWVSVVGEDWGQDMVDVVKVVQANGHSPIYYHPGGYVMARELEYGGVKFEPLTCRDNPVGPGYAIIHGVTKVRNADCYPWIFSKEPLHVVNGRTFIYRLEAPPAVLKGGKLRPPSGATKKVMEEDKDE